MMICLFLGVKVIIALNVENRGNRILDAPTGVIALKDKYAWNTNLLCLNSLHTRSAKSLTISYRPSMKSTQLL